MQTIDMSFILLITSTLLILFLIRYALKSKPITQIQKLFALMLGSVFIICIGLIIQKLCFLGFHIEPVDFEGFVYIGTCLFPVMFFLMVSSFTKPNFKFNKKHILLFIIPIIDILSVFTNSLHHLFYVFYSFNLSEMVYGPIMYLHLAYTYGIFFIGILMLIKHSAKNSGFFSKQTILIIIGVSFPVIVNVLGSFNLIEMNVYTTPISFSFAVIFLTLAILKFNFLSIAPIALEKVVDRMSDCYVVLNEKNTIVDFNKPFVNTFKFAENKIRNNNISIAAENISSFDKLEKAIQAVSMTSRTVSYETYSENINQYFNVEVSSIVDNGMFLGTLILLKDITQHEEDLKTIKDNQDMLVERERFASLGQMIGGIAHNLKTPIMSIAGAAEALNDLITEYDISLGDKEVTIEDHHAIAEDMRSWVSKVKVHTAYMSDVITAVKGQAISSTEVADSFTIGDLIKRVSILMKHELKHSLIDLNTELKLNEDFKLRGNLNSLVQVIDNLVSNAIQSYNGAPDNVIDFILEKIDNNVVISIRDYGSGMSKEIQDSLFKQMITTKGKNGTGLGLFMSYSNIKAKFNGNITFESEEGKGSTFHILLPIS